MDFISISIVLLLLFDLIKSDDNISFVIVVIFWVLLIVAMLYKGQ